MDSLLQFWSNQWNAHPQWLVATSLAVVVALFLWLIARFVGWLLKWILYGAAFAFTLGVILYFFG